MSQSDYRKYWYLKLPRDFFEQHDVKVLGSMKDGKVYQLIYLKLLCESITHNGELRFNEELPYTNEMLATICNVNLKVMDSAMAGLKSLGLVEITDDGTIVLTEVYKMIGCETGQTIRKREYRERQKESENNEGGIKGGKMSHTCPTLVPHLSHDCPQEIEIEKEIDIEIDKENDSKESKRNQEEQEVEPQLLAFDLETEEGREAMAKHLEWLEERSERLRSER